MNNRVNALRKDSTSEKSDRHTVVYGNKTHISGRIVGILDFYLVGICWGCLGPYVQDLGGGTQIDFHTVLNVCWHAF